MVKATQTPLLLAASVAASLPSLTAAGVRDYAQLGQPCMQRFDASSQVYKDISSLWKRSDKCQPGLVSNSTTKPASQQFALTCFVAPNDTGMDPRSGSMDLEGTCLKASCVGITASNQDTLEPTSERVTICHRTENEMNPWVRMTVDKQAWLDQGNDCGFTTEDYIVKEHGSLATIEDSMNKGLITDFTTTQEYWEYWDRACPYVRQNPDHPHRCCQGPDCCGDAQDDVPQEQQDPTPSNSEFQRKLQTTGCYSNLADTFSQDIYITFMGASNQATSIQGRLGGTAGIQDIEESIKETYNNQASYGQCVYYNRVIQTVSIDTDGPMVPAMNRDYLLDGFRVKATVTGQCNGCQNHLFLPSDSCRDTLPSTCESCLAPDGSAGEIIQIAGKDIYPLVNQDLSLDGTGAQIYRIQGDVDGEETCSAGQSKYLEATGEVVCL